MEPLGPLVYLSYLCTTHYCLPPSVGGANIGENVGGVARILLQFTNGNANGSPTYKCHHGNIITGRRDPPGFDSDFDSEPMLIG